eukprot:3086067-Pleurochrysis_carterae.AAC.3
MILATQRCHAVRWIRRATARGPLTRAALSHAPPPPAHILEKRKIEPDYFTSACGRLSSCTSARLGDFN